MAEPNEFRCPDGHVFTTKRSFRAFCPNCGKSSRRIYEGDPAPSNDGADEPKDGQAKDDSPRDKDRSDDTKEEGKVQGKPTRKFQARRVVVRSSGKKPIPKKAPTPKEPVSKTKIISRRRTEAGPSVSKRVVTNKDKANKAKATGGGEFSTTWQRIKRISGF